MMVLFTVRRACHYIFASRKFDQGDRLAAAWAPERGEERAREKNSVEYNTLDEYTRR